MSIWPMYKQILARVVCVTLCLVASFDFGPQHVLTDQNLPAHAPQPENGSKTGVGRPRKDALFVAGHDQVNYLALSLETSPT